MTFFGRIRIHNSAVKTQKDEPRNLNSPSVVVSMFLPPRWHSAWWRSWQRTASYWARKIYDRQAWWWGAALQRQKNNTIDNAHSKHFANTARRAKPPFLYLVNPFKPLLFIESLQAFFNFHPIIFLNISLDEVRTYNKEMKDDNGCCLLF